MTELRANGVLQAYPSATKDPGTRRLLDGLGRHGAAAPVWATIANRYVQVQFETGLKGRQVALLGDPVVSRLDEVLWVVDVNRQSLDRVVPGIATGCLERMFEAAGWHFSSSGTAGASPRPSSGRAARRCARASTSRTARCRANWPQHRTA